MSNNKVIKFDFISSRLFFVKIAENDSLNLKLWHYLSVFEDHVFGIKLQYDRICEDLTSPKEDCVPEIPKGQAGLDIYYYTMTWDKLKKVYGRIVCLIGQIYGQSSAISDEFKDEFREWKRRIQHLFSEYKDDIRNEYEHPSLEFYTVGGANLWGNIFMDKSGDIKSHTGGKQFVEIKKEHVERIQRLRTVLFDLFIKHYSDQPMSKNLFEMRDYIQDNIDCLKEELEKKKMNGDINGFNELFGTLINWDSCLSRAGFCLPWDVKDKLYSFPLMLAAEKVSSSGL